MSEWSEISGLGRDLAELALERSSPDGSVRARSRGDRVEVTLVAPDPDADALGSALATVCSDLLAARLAARSNLRMRTLDPDPRPRSAVEAEADDRLAALSVEARSGPDGVIVRVQGGHRVTVDLGGRSDPADIGPAVGAALTVALAEHRRAAYGVRRELWGRPPGRSAERRL